MKISPHDNYRAHGKEIHVKQFLLCVYFKLNIRSRISFMTTMKLICCLAHFFITDFSINIFQCKCCNSPSSISACNQYGFTWNERSCSRSPTTPCQFPSQCTVANFWLRSWKGESKPSEGRFQRNSRASTTRCRRTDEVAKRKKEGFRGSGSRRIKSPLVLFNPAGVHLSRVRTQSLHSTTAFESAKHVFVFLSRRFSTESLNYSTDYTQLANVNDKYVDPRFPTFSFLRYRFRHVSAALHSYSKVEIADDVIVQTPTCRSILRPNWIALTPFNVWVIHFVTNADASFY
jgi:hypothetical protein